MGRLTKDPDGTVYGCPDCGMAGEVYERTHENKDFDDRCKCHKCGATFDDPVERDPKPLSFGGDAGSAPEDPDGLPSTLNPDAKRLIRQARDS